MMGTATHSPVALRLDPAGAARLEVLARGRPLVIDHYASRRCGVTIGDLRARFDAALPEVDVVELDPIGAVQVLVERALLQLLGSGASLRIGGPRSLSKVGVDLDRPELWLEFLEGHPERRR
jgi:hypothetical protein